MNPIPANTWTRRLDAAEPSSATHTFSRPPILEALSLLPIAYRVGTYISNERSQGSEPIFDLSGLCLEPPKPGPHAGVPLGGLGGGCIGRGFKGEFRRWSLDPGRYVHRVISADVFSLRVKRWDTVYTKVLSVEKGAEHSASALSRWDWGLDPACATYHALYPRSWTVYKNPVPDITVTIEQVSPFLPGSYSESSLPCAVFHVEVVNTSTESEAEVSVMFTFQNGYDGGTSCTACGTSSTNGCCTCSAARDTSSNADNPLCGPFRDSDGGLTHCDFQYTSTVDAPLRPLQTSSAEQAVNHTEGCVDKIAGVCMTRPSASLPSTGHLNCTCSPYSSPYSSPDSSPVPSAAESAQLCGYCAQRLTGLGSFAIASSSPSATSSDTNDATSSLHPPVLSTCPQFVTESVSRENSSMYDYLCGSGDPVHTHHDHAWAHAHSSAHQLWHSFTTTGDIHEIHDTVGIEGSGSDANQRNVSQAGTHVGGAVCLRQWLAPATSSASSLSTATSAATAGAGSNRKIFPFSLSWDNPFVRFGQTSNASTHTTNTNSNTNTNNSSSTNSGTNSVSGLVLPRYYTKFFGTSGLSAPELAAYALLQVHDWKQRIDHWQQTTLQKNQSTASVHSPLDTTADETTNPEHTEQQKQSDNYYEHMLFNELYFLADGGTVWTDSTAGVSNQTNTQSLLGKESTVIHASGYQDKDEGRKGGDYSANNNDTVQGSNSQDALLEPLYVADTNRETTDASSTKKNKHHYRHSHISYSQLHTHLSTLHIDRLQSRYLTMKTHDNLAQNSNGNQHLVGQFLYLEGHEYLMYNTYDVHFYASFALLMLWPQLELSLQRDFARAVAAEDKSSRVMMGTGDSRPRKVKGVVPHDLGSPSEQPFFKTNAYNFQDVSRWKDLGPKFVLQVYRDYQYLHRTRGSGMNSTMHNKYNKNNQHNNSEGHASVIVAPIQPADGINTNTTSEDSFTHGMEEFLKEIYPVLLVVMQSTELFDTDKDGMIENAGFPDQTYDIWIAEGVHAYCGGLWIAACEAMSSAATIVQDTSTAVYYTNLAHQARSVYMEKLWNGRYLNYDSSTSYHHNSIMADMLAGQWYSHACALPPVLPPQVAMSCFSTIYQHNVLDFGQGKLIGAVNGMRPPAEYDTKVGKVGLSTRVDGVHGGTAAVTGTEATSTGSDEPDASTALTSMPPVSTPIVPLHQQNKNKNVSKAQVDNSCMQSREVWTGTTYALAAAMIQEAHYCNNNNNSNSGDTINNDTGGGLSSGLGGKPAAMDLSSGVDSPADLVSEKKVDAQGKVEMVARKGDVPGTVPTLAPEPLSRELIHANSVHSIHATQTKTPTSQVHLPLHTQLSPAERALLLEMAHSTAQGVHDGGWQEFGYWFATPEGWERNGNYRSLGYMRALGIWAMQFAKEQR